MAIVYVDNGRRRGSSDFYSGLKSNLSLIPGFRKGCSKLINNTSNKVKIYHRTSIDRIFIICYNMNELI